MPKFVSRDASFFAARGGGQPFNPRKILRDRGFSSAFATYSREHFLNYLSAKGIGHGRKILLPKFLCNTLVDAALQSGATVSFYDVDPAKNLTYDTDQIRELTDDKTRLVVFVDYFGVPARVDVELFKELKARGILLMRDAAHGYLALHASGFSGGENFDVTITSLYKNLPVFVGSLIFGKALPLLPDGVGAAEFFSRAARVSVKNLVAPFILHRLGRRMLKHTCERSEEVSGYGINMSGLYQRLMRGMDVEGEIAKRRAILREYREIITSHGGESVKNLFTPEVDATAVPMGWPLWFATTGARDAFFHAAFSRGIDAYTWPAMSPENCDKSIWERLLVFPVSRNLSKGLRDVMSDGHVPLRGKPLQPAT